VTSGRSLALAAAGGLLLILTAIGLHLQRADRLDGFVAVALAQGAVYLGAAGIAWNGGSGRRVLALILVVGGVMRVAILGAPPYLSTDVYRYVWDGRVAAAGINPYRYIPTDPHLAALRDRDIFPRINRNTYAPTIYPPLAQALFLAVTRVSQSVTAMKAAMVACEAIAVAILIRLLALEGLPRARILLYAWHPLPAWEFAGSGHIDAAIVLFVVLTLWSRRRFGEAPAGLALAAAFLVKLYPAVLLPAFLRRRDWRLPAIFAAAVALAYLPFLGVGWGVFGFLPGYAAEEGFTDSGAGFYWWSLARAVLPLGAVPVLAYLAAAAALLGALAVRVVATPNSRDHDIAAAALLAAAFIALVSPHYPWYFAWLIIFPCLLPSSSLLWLTTASFLLYLVPVGAHLVRDNHRLLVESAVYGPFAVLAAIDLWRRRQASIAAVGSS